MLLKDATDFKNTLDTLFASEVRFSVLADGKEQNIFGLEPSRIGIQALSSDVSGIKKTELVSTRVEKVFGPKWMPVANTDCLLYLKKAVLQSGY